MDKKKIKFTLNLGTMTGQEIERYWMQVRRWRYDSYPRLCALVDAWTDTDIKEFNEGLMLVSALRSARDFVGGAYRMDVRRRMKTMHAFLDEIDKYIRRNAPELYIIVEDSDDGIQVTSKDDQHKADTPEKRQIRKFVARVSRPATVDENGEAVAPKKAEIPEVDGRRPQHLSQYIHVLPPQLQKGSQNLEGWYLLLADYHNHLHLLVDDPRSSKADRQYYAEQTALVEQKILNLWHRIDVAWEKSQGRTVDPALEKSLAKEARNLATTGKIKGDQEYTRDEIELIEDGEEKERIKVARIQRDRHFIARCNADEKPASKEKVYQAMLELHEWGILLPPNAKETARGYGLEIPDEWIALSSEEKAELERKRQEMEQRRLDEERRQQELALQQEEERKEAEKAAKAAERKAKREARKKALAELFEKGTSING